MSEPLDIVILGLSITSSWGNGHATTWRSLVRGLAARGHRILFLERDAPWYAGNRDEPKPDGATTVLYQSVDELIGTFEKQVANASLVMVGSYVPDGIRIGEWVTSIANGVCAFYDIDTPITMRQLRAGGADYINADLISKYDAYLSFTGGPTLKELETRYGSPMARPLYCSVDQQIYQPIESPARWGLGYLGTYSEDRQPALNQLLIEPANRAKESSFAVAGPQYPASIEWPNNVDRFIHLSPREHPAFYGSQRFTLNVTREAMKEAGYSPSVRLFEAGACAVPVISDWWEGLDNFFTLGKEVLVAESTEDVLRYLRDLPDAERRALGMAARRRVLAEHTPLTRALQIELYFKEMNDHLSTGTARRNRRRGEGAHRVASRPLTQQNGQGAGGATGKTTGASNSASGVHQPSGAHV